MKRFTGRTESMLLLSLLLAGTAAHAGAIPLTVNGTVHSLANKSRTMALDVADKQTLIFRFNDQTAYRGVPGAKNISPGEKLSIEYQHEGDDNLATRITKVIPKLPDAVGEMPLKEIEGLIARGTKSGGYLLIDARPAPRYAAGHLPTAVSIPLSALEKQNAQLLPSAKDTLLVFYCGGDSCGLSHQSARIACDLGFSRVKVYTGGESGWNKAEHYTVPSADFLKQGNLVLVDLRQPQAAAAGHIPGAVNIPLAQLEGWEAKFPSTKGAQLVFYGDTEGDVAAAVSTARDWGFTNVTGFPGGVREWQQAGYRLEQGDSSGPIVYRKVLGPGEMGSAEFNRGLQEGTFLVDVRTPEEYAKERMPRAVNIPAEQMAKRFGELPQGKQVVFYCNTGTRAEVAFDIVKGKPYAVRFLNANVEFKEDGSYLVSE